MAFLQIEKLSKAYDQHDVLKDLSISFQSGEQVLLLGQNGSGKSTLLKLCVGLLKPDSGSILFQEKGSPIAAYLGDGLGLYTCLSVEENLSLFGKLYGTSESIESLVKVFELKDYSSTKVSKLSKGLMYRAALARTFLVSSKYIFLDEPSSHLDLSGLNRLIKQLENVSDLFNGELLQIVVTHDVTRFKDYMNRTVLLGEGGILKDSAEGLSCDEVISSYQSNNR